MKKNVSTMKTMNNNVNIKPFNFNEAVKGAKVVTRLGLDVALFVFAVTFIVGVDEDSVLFVVIIEIVDNVKLEIVAVVIGEYYKISLFVHGNISFGLNLIVPHALYPISAFIATG